MDTPEGYVPIIHKKCGKVAFFYVETCKPHDPVESSKVLKLDGTHPEFRSLMLCESCGEMLLGRLSIINRSAE